MWQADAARLAEEISRHFGLHFEGLSGRNDSGEFRIDLAPAGIHPHESFRIRLELGWRSLHASFLPGTYAAHLISEMGNALPIAHDVFLRLAEKCLEDNAKLTVSINGTVVSTTDVTSWPNAWQSFDLSLHKTPIAINTEDHGENDRLLSLWARRFTGLIITLVPLEEVEEPAEFNPEGLPEGDRVSVLVNRYERNYANRMACLELLGYRCLACGFDFVERYGTIGEGFIHVHHVVPVSQLGPGYIINPATDLVPLCPNCHAMVHRSSPPLTVEDLKKLLTSAEDPSA